MSKTKERTLALDAAVEAFKIKHAERVQNLKEAREELLDDIATAYEAAALAQAPVPRKHLAGAKVTSCPHPIHYWDVEMLRPRSDISVTLSGGATMRFPVRLDPKVRRTLNARLKRFKAERAAVANEAATNDRGYRANIIREALKKNPRAIDSIVRLVNRITKEAK